MLPCEPSHDPKAATAHVPPVHDDPPPRPIGPERLRALREAILNGTYPMEAAVTQGLLTLFRTPPPPASGDAPRQA